MQIIKIFLASSTELKDDRREFEVFINRKNKEYVEKEHIFLKLVLWEDFIDAMSQTRLQDEYNKAIEDCDIFVSLFHTKVGKYTEEEFERAFKTFKVDNKPFIYTYFKDEAVNMGQISDRIVTLLDFKKKLSDLGHFYTNYDDINELKYKFSEQLIKVLPILTGVSPSKIEQQSGNENHNVTKVVQNFYGNVGSSTGNVGGNQNLKDTNIKGERTIEIKGGTINVSGAGAFALGNIDGTVANTINERPSLSNLDELETRENNPSRNFWARRLKAKEEELAAIEDQLGGTLSKRDELKLNREAETLLKEIEELKEKIG